MTRAQSIFRGLAGVAALEAGLAECGIKTPADVLQFDGSLLVTTLTQMGHGGVATSSVVESVQAAARAAIAADPTLEDVTSM